GDVAYGRADLPPEAAGKQERHSGRADSDAARHQRRRNDGAAEERAEPGGVATEWIRNQPDERAGEHVARDDGAQIALTFDVSSHVQRCPAPKRERDPGRERERLLA